MLFRHASHNKCYCDKLYLYIAGAPVEFLVTQGISTFLKQGWLTTPTDTLPRVTTVREDHSSKTRHEITLLTQYAKLIQIVI